MYLTNHIWIHKWSDFILTDPHLDVPNESSKQSKIEACYDGNFFETNLDVPNEPLQQKKKADNVYRPYHLVKVEDVTQGTAALQIEHILKSTIQQLRWVHI